MIVRMPDSANTPIPTDAAGPQRWPQDLWTVQDALGRSVLVPRKPQAIVSLVPSQTELLFALGVGAQVVGVSDYCVHPQAQLAGLPRVGGQILDEFFYESTFIIACSAVLVNMQDAKICAGPAR